MIRILKYITMISLVVSLSKIAFAQSSCGVPDVLTFGTNQTITTVTPYWDTVPGAVSYNLQYRIRNINATYSASLNTPTNHITLTNLVLVTDYEFIVQSVCSGEVSPFSSSGWFTTPGGGSSAVVTRGPYMTVPSSNRVTIQWKTDIACNSEVMFGSSASNLTDYSNKAAMTTDHCITLTNLQPNTKYYYSIGVIGTPLEASAENFFYTAPVDNDSIPLRFWVTGDFGVGSSGQRAVRDAFVNYNAGQKVNGWLWLGDNAYANGTDQEYQDKVFDVYPTQFKKIPVFPAPGNHDYAQSGYQSTASLGTAFPYFDIFNIPTNSGTEKYYSANYGNVHFIALDSYGSYNNSASDMYRWLENDLSNNNQQWTIVYFHHAPYSKGSHDSDNSDEMFDMRNNIIPLLESNGVDLVMGGHSHSYERSKFIKGHYGVANTFNSSHVVQSGPGPYIKNSRTGDGTVYVVCGVSGQLESTASGYPHDAMYYSTTGSYGSLVLDITGNNLAGSFVTSNGSVLDNFIISKPSTPTISSINEYPAAKDLEFSLFPNPADNYFNIAFNNKNNLPNQIRITNILGQEVYNMFSDSKSYNSTVKISKNEISNLTPGVYYVSCINNISTTTKPIILE